MIYEHFTRDPKNNVFLPEKFDPIEDIPVLPNKPLRGGLWASPSLAMISWSVQCDFEGSPDDRINTWFGFKFKLLNSSRLAVIEETGDVELLPLHDGTTELIDWVKVAQDWDAVIVQGNALDQSGPFWGWDVDSLLVLNPDVVENIGPLDIQK